MEVEAFDARQAVLGRVLTGLAWRLARLTLFAGCRYRRIRALLKAPLAVEEDSQIAGVGTITTKASLTVCTFIAWGLAACAERCLRIQVSSIGACGVTCECSWLSVRRDARRITKGARCSRQLALHALIIVTRRTYTSCILEVAAAAVTHALVVLQVQVVA